MKKMENKGKNHIITSQIEHNSTYQTCRTLEKNGFKVTYIGVDQEGLVNLEELDKALQNNNVGIVSLLLVNNETGTVQDFAQIREIINKHKVPLHYDAVQAAGKMTINVNSLQASLLSLSAHKIYGPKGAGALYVKSGINIDSPAGTKNVPAIVGMGAACSQAQKELCDYIQHCRKIRDYLESKIAANFPFTNLNGNYKQRVCNTTNISFSGFSAKNLSEELDRCGIAVSTGAACSEEKDEASRILTAMQLPASKLFGALRFSVGKQTTKEDIDYTIEKLYEIFNKKEKAVGNSKILNLEE
jgi:cysteine desulfurase